MKYFSNITDLPVHDLNNELGKLIKNKKLEWDSVKNQFCLNTILGKESDYIFGTGSLTHNWDTAREEPDEYGINRTLVDPYTDPYTESDFTILCDQFKGTLFEDVYHALERKYHLGRVRIMRSKSKTCLSWHTDSNPRVHYAIKTQPGAFMVIEDEVMHLPQSTWWWTNTLANHTAFNGSMFDRIHLVATIIGVR